MIQLTKPYARNENFVEVCTFFQMSWILKVQQQEDNQLNLIISI